MNARVDLAPVKDWRDFAKSYTAHPLAEVFPLLDEDSKDFIDLASSIGIHGVLDPIVLTRDMRVLDGRNRLRAALQALHPTDTEHAPRFVFFDELPIDHDALDEAGYVAAKNLHRRHLTDDQKAAAAAAIYHGHKAAANESRKKHLIPGAIHRGGQTSPTKKSTQRTREKVQEAAGVSERKARQALAVVEEAEGSITRSNKRSLLWKCVPAPLGADGPAVKVDAKTPKGVLRVMVTINTDIPYLAKAWRSEEFKRHLAAFIVPGGVFEDERAGAALYELMRPGTQLSFDNGVEHSTLMEIASIVLNRFDQANSLPRIAS